MNHNQIPVYKTFAEKHMALFPEPWKGMFFEKKAGDYYLIRTTLNDKHIDQLFVLSLYSESKYDNHNVITGLIAVTLTLIILLAVLLSANISLGDVVWYEVTVVLLFTTANSIVKYHKLKSERLRDAKNFLAYLAANYDGGDKSPYIRILSNVDLARK